MSIAPASTTELPKSYEPSDHEPTIHAKWMESRAFHTEPTTGAEPPRYCIVIPPPNVTAALHIGHALNNTLQDVLIRYHRMRGFNTLWLPGTDHAGIATQTVVEKRLLQLEGKKRTDYERETFVERVQQWKDEYEATITGQLQAIGCSCDWERQRFTMDAVCAKAVREAFFQLFRDGLIYRGKRLVNWDPATLTALADDEVENVEVDGSFWYMRYPLVHPPRNPDDPQDTEPATWSELAARGYPVPEDADHSDDKPAWVTVATTRPETYLGDTAVAVNPHDPRAGSLRGLMVQLPLVGRIIPIIEDEYVVLPVSMGGEEGDPKAEYATGFLKVTPAHDPNDWDIGQRHGLPVINVMAPDASISDAHGWEDVGGGHLFVGMSREHARKKVIKEFEARGLLEKTRAYRHTVGHSYRSHVPIEPYLSDQWYVKVSDDRLVGEAQRALADDQYAGHKPARLDPQNKQALEGEAATRGYDGALRFYPDRYARMYQSWHENLRDWCISRQLWWGHRIPVWRREHGATELPEEFSAWVEQLMEWGRGGRVAFQYRGEFVPLERLEKEDLDLTAFFICVRDPEGDDREIVEFLESHDLVQDPDVLDTWFSSALWPLSTMGWPDPNERDETAGLLEAFNPTSVLCTGRDIITLWVSRMVMFNRYFNDGAVPFHHVYINPMIQDGHGQRMSKSLGNGVDPRDIVHSHGADALRFTMVQMATSTQDVRLPVDMVSPFTGETFHPKEITSPQGYRVAAPVQTCPRTGHEMVSGYGTASGEAKPSDDRPLARNTSPKFDLGRNFCNKLWNATRFALSNLKDADPGDTELAASELGLLDRWILSRLRHTVDAINCAVGEYQFNVYADQMYDFVWRDFCDWHLEAVKPTIRDSREQQQVLRTVLSAIVRMLHPIAPFVTETLWPSVRGTGEAGVRGVELPDGEVLALTAWPLVDESLADDEAEATFERAQNLVNAIRGLRAKNKVGPKKKITLSATASAAALVEATGEVVPTLAGLEQVLRVEDGRPADALPLAFEGDELLLSGLVDAVDMDAERQRLTKLIAEKEKAIKGYRAKLSNEGYVNNAPANVVEETRQRLAEAEADLSAAEQALKALG